MKVEKGFRSSNDGGRSGSSTTDRGEAASVVTLDTRDQVPSQLEELRELFARGISPSAAAALLRVREQGVHWETAALTVAQGVAVSYPLDPIAQQPQRARPAWWTWQGVVWGLALYVALRPLIALCHEAAAAMLAMVLHALVMSGVWHPVLAVVPLDPIYLGAAILAAGGVQVQGLAVAGLAGAALHALLPGLFLSPDLAADGAGVSMVAAPGATLIGRGLSTFGSHVLELAVGVLLFRRARAHGQPWLAVFGLLLQAQVVVRHLLNTAITVDDIEASGLPFAVSLLLPAGGAWFTEHLGQLAVEVRGPMVGAALTGAAYALVLGPLLTLYAARHAPTLYRRTVSVLRSPRTPALRPARSPLWAGMAIAVATAISPVGALALGEPNWKPIDAVPATLARVSRRGAGAPRALHLSGPTIVQIEQAGAESHERSAGRALPSPTTVQIEQARGWQYLVNGRPEIIRGVGYNPRYSSLGRGERARLYERDFSSMRQIGVNTIEGWFEDQFDEVTLDRAAENGLGVLMPFELNQDWNYEDPVVQQQIIDRVSTWVGRYKNHPAVRMWAPGNENLHRVLYPNWISQENVPAARVKADAFVAFLPRLVDRIHEIDPNHPVLYRDAEDVYLPRLKAAFDRTAVDRSWLIYGANVYTSPRLEAIIAQWPSQWIGGPLLISEFAPGGLAKPERPAGFQRDWATIRSRPGIVLGGLAYAWATNGPEQVDRVFGLVGPNGMPVDNSLTALSAAYLSDPEP